MMNLTKTLSAFAVMAAVSGCSTIEFTNGEGMSNEQYSVWHHNVAYSLYEVSPPVQPSKFCPDGWSKVTVEKDIVTAIGGSVDEAMTFGAVDIWDPWAVSINCAR